MHMSTARKIIRNMNLSDTEAACIEVQTGGQIEVMVPMEDFVDYDRTEALADRVMDAMKAEGHFISGWRTGYGSWIINDDFKVSADDFNDPSNPNHY